MLSLTLKRQVDLHFMCRLWQSVIRTESLVHLETRSLKPFSKWFSK